MMRGRRREDRIEWSALLRLSREDQMLYEGELHPGHRVELEDGLRLEVLWVRSHYPPPDAEPAKS